VQYSICTRSERRMGGVPMPREGGRGRPMGGADGLGYRRGLPPGAAVPVPPPPLTAVVVVYPALRNPACWCVVGGLHMWFDSWGSG